MSLSPVDHPAVPTELKGTMLSEYEKRALQQIHAWKNPEPTWFDSAMTYVNKPLAIAGQAMEKIPGYDKMPGFAEACAKSMQGIVGLINDASQWSVRPPAILAELSKISGKAVTNLDQVPALDLQDIDRAIGWLDTKYEGIALVEGAVAGGAATLTPAAALATIPADLLALTAMNLRAIGEYGTYCGFDVSTQQERLFALNILALASSTSDSGKQAAFAHLVKIAQDVATKKTWKHLEQHAFVRVVQSIAEAMSINLTKAKLANVLPVAGAVIGGGFNAYYTDKVCKAAFYLYRERLLAVKQGASVIEVVVEPAKDAAWSEEERVP